MTFKIENTLEGALFTAIDCIKMHEAEKLARAIRAEIRAIANEPQPEPPAFAVGDRVRCVQMPSIEGTYIETVHRAKMDMDNDPTDWAIDALEPAQPAPLGAPALPEGVMLAEIPAPLSYASAGFPWEHWSASLEQDEDKDWSVEFTIKNSDGLHKVYMNQDMIEEMHDWSGKAFEALKARANNGR